MTVIQRKLNLKATLNFLKKQNAIITSLMAILIALFSFFATYKNTQLVEEQNRKIYFDNLLDKISKLTIIEDNSNDNLQNYKSLYISILKRYMENNNFNLYRKDLKLLHNYQRNIINELRELRLVYEYLLSFSNQWSTLNEENLRLLKVQYIIFRQNSERLQKVLYKKTNDIKNILLNKETIKYEVDLETQLMRIPSQNILYMLFMQNVDINELENIKEEENIKLINADMKDSIFDVNISNDSLYYFLK